MRFVVIQKNPNGSEMHVLRNGNLSHYGTPRKFLSKEAARGVAQEWADHNADRGDDRSRVVVRKVD